MMSAYDRWVTSTPWDYEPEPIALDCPSCHAHIEIAGYTHDQIANGVFTLGKWDAWGCPKCGVTYGEGDTLGCVMDGASACGGWGCVDGCGDCAPACPFCSEAHAPGKCPVAAAMTGTPLIAGLKQEVARLTAERNELRQLCHDAKDVINGLQKRLADKGLLGIADDLNGFYNGTGTDGWNVQVCMRLIDATTINERTLNHHGRTRVHPHRTPARRGR